MATTQMKLAQLRPLAWDLLSLISCVIGLSFLFIGASILILSADSLISLRVMPKEIGETLSLFGQIFVWFMFGVCISRYLRRIDPLQYEHGKPVRAARLKISLVSAYALLLVFPGNGTDLLGLVSLTALIPVGFSLYERYISNYSPTDEPFVLFLRGFGGAADRSVTPSVLDAIPGGRRVVFLVPRFSATDQWDPFTIGLSGFRLRQPMRSMPIYISATAEEWVEVVRNLIRRAESIVIDLSRDSDAIRTELQLIVSEGRMGATILIEPAKDSPSEAILRALLPLNSEAPCLRWYYRKTWLGGFLRVIGGLVLIPVVILILIAALSSIVPVLSFRTVENLSIVSVLLFVYPFFAKPLIGRDLRRVLATTLSSISMASPPLPRPQIREEIHRDPALPNTPLARRVGRQGVIGILLCGFGLEGVVFEMFFSWIRGGLSPFWQAAFKALGWTIAFAGAMSIAQGVLSVRTRRTGSGWMTTGDLTGRPESENAQVAIRQTIFREWVDQFIEAVSYKALSLAFWLAMLSAVGFFIYSPILLWALFFFVLGFLALFALGDFLGSLKARHRLLSNLDAACPTDDELRQLLEYHGVAQAREDLDLVFVRYRARRRTVPVPLARPLHSADEVIECLQSLETLSTNRRLWLLGLSITALGYATLFEDLWAAFLGVGGLVYSSVWMDVRCLLKFHSLRRKLHYWQLTLEDHQRLIEFIGQRIWKNKEWQEKCRKVLLRAAARDTCLNKEGFEGAGPVCTPGL